MTRIDRAARLPALVGCLAAALLSGCVPPNAELAPQTARAAVRQINADWDAVDATIYAKAWLARFELRDADGRHVRFIGAARLFYDPPRRLLLNIEHSLGGTAATIGSNDERYWVTIEIEDPRLWWGTWAALEAGASAPLIIPPDQLLDVLMLRPLSPTLPEGLPPLLRVDGWDRVLEYARLDAEGWPYIARRVVLTDAEKYRPRRIIDYDAAGRELMRADLSSYAPIGGDGPLTPRRYAVRWGDGTEMHLELERVELRGDIDPPCEFPAQWTGAAECLDRLPPTHALDENWPTSGPSPQTLETESP